LDCLSSENYTLKVPLANLSLDCLSSENYKLKEGEGGKRERDHKYVMKAMNILLSL
jgi:hypothetical protein